MKLITKLKLFLTIFILSQSFSQSNGFSHKKIYPQRTALLQDPNRDRDVGDPLILTPYINAGKLEEARNLARVTNLTEVISYSGFLTVNPQYNSNMYFWFFPAAVRVF